MNNRTIDEVNEPFDPREGERLSCVRLGRMPRLRKFDSVWHKDADGWWAVVVERRCPGDVYWARHKVGRLRGTAVVVSCGTFGGFV